MKSKKLYFVLISLLITVFVFNLPILSTFRNQIRCKVKVDLINKNLRNKKVIIFEEETLKDVHWIDQHEFIVNNEMYDIITKEEKNGKIIYHCFKDSGENSVRKIQKFIAENLSFKSYQIPEIGVPQMVFHAPKDPFFEKTETEKIALKNMTFSTAEFPSLKCNFVDLYYAKFKIPPENYR